MNPGRPRPAFPVLGVSPSWSNSCSP